MTSPSPFPVSSPDGPSRILVVGAGAVGQIYGRALQRTGAQVTFLVKPRHLESCRRGFTLYLLRAGKARQSSFQPDGLIVDAAQASADRWDQVWLCVSSTAIRSAWLDELAPALGNAIVVSLTPGLEDREYLEERIDPARLVTGVIGIVAYQTPLDGEIRPEPGIAYWVPPATATAFDGPPALAREVAAGLRRGGLPARFRPKAWKMGALASAIMMPHLASLELEGWSLRQLRRSGRLASAAAAAREALRIVAAHHGERPPWRRALIRSWLMRLALALAPRVTPFDLETYLAYHFTKLGDQTRFMLGRYVERGESLGLPVDALRALTRELVKTSADGASPPPDTPRGA